MYDDILKIGSKTDELLEEYALLLEDRKLTKEELRDYLLEFYIDITDKDYLEECKNEK